MITVIVGYKVKNDVDIQPVLFKLMSHAMTYPGFIAAENLRSQVDPSLVAMLQTWEHVENWRFWETSKIRQSILHEAASLFAEEPQITIYTVMPTTAWQ